MDYPVSPPTKFEICSLFSCANFLIIFLLLNFSKSSLVFLALELASCAWLCNLSALSNPFFAAALPECAKSITLPTGVLDKPVTSATLSAIAKPLSTCFIILSA
jgi:hypothetical protein